MISKELLSKVMEDMVVSIYPTVQSGMVLYTNTFGIQEEINLYELAHKCKEWAKSYDYDIWSGWDTNMYIAKVNPDFDDSEDYWCEESTEPEAIIKATYWVLDNIKEIESTGGSEKK